MSRNEQHDLIEDKFNGAMVNQYISAQLFERVQREKSAAEFEHSRHVFEYCLKRQAQVMDRRKHYETEFRNALGLVVKDDH